ncbi:Putative tyrosine-protein kinase in cps region [Rubripirellula lacrimiformis]|uniref:Tyrosine-protein kinase in cps region n=1 Tax=Rubripirellula lacrimiformis TaxID=1930273 RepID=A0A517NHZ2_9BACT|nr:GumC family protein [Rubripirellula lacrimiformis]QDT06673.1 Putative tyrosine-protein kinase in cps region [Rubripirellula lacrimiformis]
MPNSLDQWTYAIKRHWFLSLAAFASVMGLTVLVILFAPRAYRSESKLMLRIGRESVSLDPTAGAVGETISLHHTRANEIQSAIGVMHSREVLEHVIDKVGVDTVLSGESGDEVDAAPPSWMPQWVRGSAEQIRGRIASIDPVPAREAALTKLQRGVEIGSATESSVVSVHYETDSPDVAQQVVAAWVDSYVAHHAKVNHSAGTYAFFEQQGEMLRDQLDLARVELLDAKNDSNLVTIEGQQKLLEAQLSKVRDNLIDTEGEIASTKSRLGSYDDLLRNFDETITEEVTGIANEGRDQMRTQLFELEVLEKDLRSKYRPGHPKLVAIEGQLADAAKIVAELTGERKEVTRSVNPAHQQLVEYKMLDIATLSGLQEKQKALQQKRDALQQEAIELNRNEQSILAVSNDVQILEERYLRHAEKLEQARLDEVLSDQKLTSVNVVQPASLEHRPVTPNKALCAIAGLFAACAAAISLPVLAEVRSSGHRDTRSARRTHRDWKFEKRSDGPDVGAPVSPHYEPDDIATVASMTSSDS